MENSKIKENLMGSILQFSIPSIVAMLLSTVITITDGYFTGNYVGEEAIAAINLGLPILYLFLGLGLSVGVGGSVISGQLLGAKDRKKSCEIFSQSMITSVIVCVVTSVIVFVLFNPIAGFLKAEGALLSYFKSYYYIMLVDYPLLVVGTVLGIFIRVDGKPQVCMIVSVLSCLINVLLDYIFVVRLSMGVTGSAIGSLIVEAFAVVVQLVYFVSASNTIKFSRFSYDKEAGKQILFNGSSEFIGEMASAIAMFAFNSALMKYVGVEGVAAYTILGFAIYGYSMISIGFGQGITPLISICWGAGDVETAQMLRKRVNTILFVIGAVFALTFIIFGESYAGVFGCGIGVKSMVSSGFKIMAITFLIMGYDVVNSMYFTSCGDAKSSAIISSLRGIILLLLFLAIFPALWGMTGVWMVTPATELITSVVSWALIRKQANGNLILCGD